jgi:lysozyme family protein
MSAASFPAALAFTLGAEGGFVDDPYDPGGPTNHGITLETFRAYGGGGETVGDLQRISPLVVAAIYRERYWQPVRGDELPAGVDLSVFDMGVNAGPRRSIELLQRVLGIRTDGEFGPETLARVREVAAATDLIAGLEWMQHFYYVGLPGWGRYGKGWQARTLARRAAANALVV